MILVTYAVDPGSSKLFFSAQIPITVVIQLHNADATKSVGEKALPFPLLSTGASVIIVSEDFKCVECVLSSPRYRFSIECDINNYSPVSNTLSIS